MRVSLFGLFLRRINLINCLMSSYNWFYRIYISHHLMLHFLLMCVCVHDTVFNTRFSIQFYRYTCTCLCTPLGTRLTTHWVASDNPGLECSDFRPWSLCILSIADMRSAMVMWIISRPSGPLFFQALLLDSRVFLL